MVVFKVIDPQSGLFILVQAHWGKKEILERSVFFHGYTFIMADLSRNLLLVLLEQRLPFLKWIFR